MWFSFLFLYIVTVFLSFFLGYLVFQSHLSLLYYFMSFICHFCVHVNFNVSFTTEFHYFGWRKDSCYFFPMHQETVKKNSSL